MKKVLHYETTEQTTVRVDKLLATTHPEYSRAALAKLFSLNLIKLNGEPIDPGHKLRPGAKVEYDLGPLQEKPEVIDLPIIYEDENIIVINKPAAIISHARGRFWQEASVASFIRDKIAQALKEGERGGIVHRLDRATSGVMVCAKNEQTLSNLQKAFEARNVSKEYIALTEKRPKEDKFIIDAPIMRDPKNPKLFKIHPSGKPSQTTVEILTSNDDRTLLLLTPKTGRTHQLRLHLNYIKCPIIGDPLYGEKAKQYNEHSNSLRLHAYKLTIPIQTKKGESKVTFTAQVPDYWQLSTDEMQGLERTI